MLSHPPTTIGGSTCKHLDHPWVPLASIFLGSIFGMSIDVHFRLRNYNFFSFTKELIGIHPSLCFKNFARLWWNCKWLKNMIVPNNMEPQISNGRNDVGQICNSLFGVGTCLTMVTMLMNILFATLCFGLKRRPPHLYFMPWGRRQHCYNGCNLCCWVRWHWVRGCYNLCTKVPPSKFGGGASMRWSMFCSLAYQVSLEGVASSWRGGGCWVGDATLELGGEETFPILWTIRVFSSCSLASK